MEAPRFEDAVAPLVTLVTVCRWGGVEGCAGDGEDDGGWNYGMAGTATKLAQRLERHSCQHASAANTQVTAPSANHHSSPHLLPTITPHRFLLKPHWTLS